MDTNSDVAQNANLNSGLLNNQFNNNVSAYVTNGPDNSPSTSSADGGDSYDDNPIDNTVSEENRAPSLTEKNAYYQSVNGELSVPERKVSAFSRKSYTHLAEEIDTHFDEAWVDLSTRHAFSYVMFGSITGVIFVTILEDLDWNYVLYCYLLAELDLVLKICSWTLRYYMLKYYVRMSQEDIDMVNNDRRERFNLAHLTRAYDLNKIKRTDSITRKSSHIISGAITVLIILPFLVGGEHTIEFTMAIFFNQARKSFCYTYVRLRWPYPPMWVMILLYGGGTRIRDGKYADLNIRWLGAAAVWACIFVWAFACWVLPYSEDEWEEMWELGLQLIYLPLSFGDAAGELIGGPFGKHTFQVRGFGETNKKSYEGCFAVFFFSVAATLFCTLTSDDIIPVGIQWLLPLGLGVLTTITETLSFRGTDNFFIPACNAIFVCVMFRLFAYDHDD